jgi:hypothetical protein
MSHRRIVPIFFSLSIALFSIWQRLRRGERQADRSLTPSVDLLRAAWRP